MPRSQLGVNVMPGAMTGVMTAAPQVFRVEGMLKAAEADGLVAGNMRNPSTLGPTNSCLVVTKDVMQQP